MATPPIPKKSPAPVSSTPREEGPSREDIIATVVQLLPQGRAPTLSALNAMLGGPSQAMELVRRRFGSYAELWNAAKAVLEEKHTATTRPSVDPPPTPKGSRPQSPRHGNQSGIEMAEIKAAIELALNRRWTVAEFESRIRKIKPRAADIFANLTHPEAGRRKSYREMARQLGYVHTDSIRNHEQLFLPLCAKRGWAVAELPQESQRRMQARQQGQRWKQLRELVVKARQEVWNRAETLAKLELIDMELATLLRRLSDTAADGPDIIVPANYHEGTLLHRLGDFCHALGWPMRRLRARESNGHAVEAQHRAREVADLMRQARSQRWTEKVFLAKLARIDPGLAAVFRNQRLPLHQRKVISVLAAEHQSNNRVIQGKIQKAVQIARAMGWVPLDPHLPRPRRERRLTTRQAGGRIVAPSAEDAAQVAAQVRALAQSPGGFAPLNENMSCPKPMITPAELKHVEPLVNVPVAVKKEEPGFKQTEVKWKDLELKPTDKHFAGKLPEPSAFEVLAIGILSYFFGARLMRTAPAMPATGSGNLFIVPLDERHPVI